MIMNFFKFFHIDDFADNFSVFYDEFQKKKHQLLLFLLPVFVFLTSCYLFYATFFESIIFVWWIKIILLFLEIFGVLYSWLLISSIKSGKYKIENELYKAESNEESQKNNNNEDNLMMGIFEMFSENEIYKKGKGTFGLESYSFESKTQLAVILCVIKFDSHKHKFSNLPQKKFLLTFKENFKNGFSLVDKEFKDKIDFTESFFSSIKKDLFEFDKMNNNILRLNQNSQYYQLYNDFLKILITKDI